MLIELVAGSKVLFVAHSPLVYGVLLDIRMYDACLDIVGVSGSALVKSRDRAVGVLDSLASAFLDRSGGVEGSSFSFSGLSIVLFRTEDSSL